MNDLFQNLAQAGRALIQGPTSVRPGTDFHSHCATCHNLDWRTTPLPDGAWRPKSGQQGFKFQVSGSSLDASAEAGCQVCTIIITVAENIWSGHRMDWVEFNITLIQDQTPKIGLASQTFFSVELYIPTDDTAQAHTGSAWHNIPPRTEISPTPASPESFTFIQRCLETCLSTHPACHSQTPATSTPRRLLEIHNSTQVRLIDLTTPTPILCPKYTALSYCWGTGKFFRTFTTNIDELSHPFSRDRLPVVLAEAVKITEHLGLKHIWIDALCILQDSATDWEMESAKMGAIYERAYLTVAASSSDSVDTSFLTSTPRAEDPRRAVGRKDTLCLNVANAEGGKKLGFWSGKAKTTTIAVRRVSTSGFHNDADLEPWSERGWTFQEAVLPTRLVSFTADEVQWSCKTVKMCECQTEEPQRQLPLPWLTEGEDRAEEDDERELGRFWTEMVERYSRRKFTFYKDKLVAIAGIASVLHGLAPSRRRYVAGMWASNLIYEMCWVSTGIGGPAEPVRDAPGYMPTFSWASVKDDIMFIGSSRSVDPTMAFEEKAELVKVDVDVSENLPFGVFKHVAVTLRGVLYPCKIVREDEWDRPPRYRLDLGVKGGHLRSFSEDVDIEAGFINTGNGMPSERVAVRSKTAPSSTRKEDGESLDSKRGNGEILREDLGAYLFHMADVHVMEEKYAYFLVLGKSTSTQGSYERLGLWNISVKEGSDAKKLGVEFSNKKATEVVIV